MSTTGVWKPLPALLLPTGSSSHPVTTLSFVPIPRALCSFSFLQYVNLILQLNKNLQGTKAFLQTSFVLSLGCPQPMMRISAPPGAGSPCDQPVLSAVSLRRLREADSSVCGWRARDGCCATGSWTQGKLCESLGFILLYLLR